MPKKIPENFLNSTVYNWEEENLLFHKNQISHINHFINNPLAIAFVKTEQITSKVHNYNPDLAAGLINDVIVLEQSLKRINQYCKDIEHYLQRDSRKEVA